VASLEASRLAFDDKFMDVRGVHSRDLDVGSGRPVVLAHGAGTGVSARANWWLNVPVLAETYRVIAPDLVGFGGSLPEDPSTYPFGIEDWVEYVAALLEGLGIGKADLIGNSLGGWVALRFAVKYRVRRAITMGSGGVPETALPLLTAHSGNVVRTEDDMRRNLAEFVVDPSIVPDELVSLRLAEASTESAMAARARTTAARARDRVTFPLSDDVLTQVKCPVLAVHGREDALISYRASIAVATGAADADMHLYAHCGHWAQIERAADFNALAQSFLD
jgi:2-hydroxymuconate-semialdehyde hydrolase